MAKKEIKSILHDVSEDMPEQPPTPEGAPASVSTLRIEEISLLRLTRFMEKERAARSELIIAGSQLNQKFQEWLKTNDEAKELNAKITALQAEQKAAQAGYQALVVRVGKEMRIDMKGYSFDDETGTLHPLPPSQPPTK